jgi:hypothetical protein
MNGPVPEQERAKNDRAYLWVFAAYFLLTFILLIAINA